MFTVCRSGGLPQDLEAGFFDWPTVANMPQTTPFKLRGASRWSISAKISHSTTAGLREATIFSCESSGKCEGTRMTIKRGLAVVQGHRIRMR